MKPWIVAGVVMGVLAGAGLRAVAADSSSYVGVTGRGNAMSDVPWNSWVSSSVGGATALRFDGALGVGVSPSTSYKLDVAGSVRSTGFFHSSDARLKEGIETAPGLDVATRLRGVTYTLKETGLPSAGVVAQEVEAVFPRAVATDPASGLKSVDYDSLTSVLIESVKQLDARVRTLEAELAEARAAKGEAR